MRKLLKFAACGFALVAAATFAGCSDGDALVDNSDAADSKPLSRSDASQVVIDFEDMYGLTPDYEDAIPMANPTSYGSNYYATTGSYAQVGMLYDISGNFSSTVNPGVWPVGTDERTSFEFGGIALSDWAMTSNPASNPNPGKPFTDEWWMSEYNQMSVYNTDRTATGNRGGAGANGSNNFGIVYGFNDSYNYNKEASFEIPMGPMTLTSLKICNTAYTYGVIQNGNVWRGEGGVTVLAESLKDTHGYLTLIIKCYNGIDLIKRIETPLADYQGSKEFCVKTWTEIPVNVANVTKVEFGFWGSDVQAGGLRTPAYVAIDDIVLE